MVTLSHRRKSFRQTTSGSGGGDPYFANVSVLLHMQGTNNGTIFTDSGPNGLAVTALGTAKTITTDFKWGNSCMSGSYLNIAVSSAMDFGTNPYTIEMWVKWNSVSGAQVLIDFGNGTMYLRFDGGNTVYLLEGGGIVINASITALSAGQWYHIAAVRSGNTRTVYVNGISVASGTRTGSAGNSSITTKVGALYDSNLAFNGKMQDLRITKGVARYTSTFAPPSAAFPDS